MYQFNKAYSLDLAKMTMGIFTTTRRLTLNGVFCNQDT